MGGVLDRLGFPAVGEHRRFVTAMAVDAVGSGVFVPVSILYFLAATDLTLVQVGGALSLAALLTLPVGPLLGGAVDRLGAKQVLLAGNLLQAAGFVAYLVVDSFAAVVLWAVVVTVGRTAFWSSYGVIVAAIAPPGEREKWFGFLGALRNVGFGVGGLVSGLAITIGTAAAYDAIVVANAASYLLALALLLAVPPTARTAHRDVAGGWRDVLADRPYRLLWVAQLAFCVASDALNLAVPVYATTVLGLPGWVTGTVFTLNTLMVGVGQGLVVRAMTGARRWRVLLLTHGLFAASFAVLLVASLLPPAAAIALVLAGVAVLTGGELLGSPVHAALSTETPEHLRGRYLALMQLAWTTSGALSPVLFAWLLHRGPEPVWAALLAVVSLGALLAPRLGRTLPAAAGTVASRVEETAGT